MNRNLLLSEALSGKKVKVTGINASADLRHRLYSFGITKGTELTVKNRGIRSATLQVIVNKTNIAIRKVEADCITVEVVE